MDWKQEYAKGIIKALNPHGEVLEIGFGLGYAATEIQAYKPKTHTIIESDPEKFKEAKKWAGKYPNAILIEDSWEHALPKLKEFDAVFFNDFILLAKGEEEQSPSTEEVSRAMKETKDLLRDIDKELSQVTAAYSDQEVEEFYQEVGQFHGGELPSFFKRLKQNGQISEQQYNNFIKKYKIGKDVKGQGMAPLMVPMDPMLECLEACLSNHMRKGGRFAFSSSNLTSKYEDPQFFEKIITNPYLEFTETVLPLTKNAEGDSPEKMLLLVVEKKV